MQLFKGGSSHWINESNLVPGKFGWGRGYGVFSVSESASRKFALTSPIRKSIIENGILSRN